MLPSCVCGPQTSKFTDLLTHTDLKKKKKNQLQKFTALTDWQYCIHRILHCAALGPLFISHRCAVLQPFLGRRGKGAVGEGGGCAGRANGKGRRLGWGALLHPQPQQRPRCVGPPGPAGPRTVSGVHPGTRDTGSIPMSP